MLIQRERPSHYYHRDGTPCHEVPKSDGNGMRATTIADARKLKLLPSVTQVLGILSRPSLEAWKMEQAILSALTLPRLPDEGDDAFAKRVVEDKDEYTEKAADLGTEIHDRCAEYANPPGGGRPYGPDDPVEKLVKPFREWFDANVLEVGLVESVVVSQTYGYAGRLDMTLNLKDVGWCVVDIKSQKVKRGKKGEPKPAFYDEWPMQLAAYRFALWEMRKEKDSSSLPMPMVSIVIDSVTPSPVHVKDWGDSEIASIGHFGAFRAALSLWKYLKEYDPTKL